jgi:hypothetical protein
MFHTPLTVAGTVVADNLEASGFSPNVAPVKVHASTTQAISSQTNTKLVFGGIDINPITTAWVVATNRYVAQTAGVYSVSGAAKTSGTNRSCKLMVYKNGVFLQNLQDNNTVTLAAPFYNGTTMIQLAAGDYIELWFYSSAATTIVANDTDFNVHRIY